MFGSSISKCRPVARLLGGPRGLYVDIMNRSSLRALAVITGMISSTLMGVATAESASATTTPTPVHVVTWNVAGANSLYSHGQIHTGMTDHIVDYLTSNFAQNEVAFVALDEVCSGQYWDIVAKLKAANWPVMASSFSHFWTERTGTQCEKSPTHSDAGNFGNAIFSNQGLDSVVHYALDSGGNVGNHDPADGSETRGMLCSYLATPAGNTSAYGCVTHPAANDPYKGAQVNLAFDDLAPLMNKSLIVAGDFNADPENGDYQTSHTTCYFSAPTCTAPWSILGSTAVYEEIGDTSTACPGYGPWTVHQQAVNPIGSSCGSDNSCRYQLSPSLVGPCRKVDMIFALKASMTSPYSYSQHTHALPSDCAWFNGTSTVPTTGNGLNPAGSCSDHRMLVGPVTMNY
jgi:endonuclease/exonuclease/phosphatase family metal-dependent hydrolase